MRNWYYRAEKDYNVKIFKFEDLTTNPVDEWLSIFKHCQIDIDRNLLEEILKDYSKKKMREKDLKRKENDKSHYKRESSNWKKVFNSKHVQLFKNINGDLMSLFDYIE